MAPSSDMTSIESQQQSFLMSNIVPQAPKNNQVQWRQLEEKIRLLNYKTKYIITGTIFTNELYIKNNIRVPSQLYKIVYVNKCYYAWIIDNKDNAVVKTITLQTIYKKTGIKYKLSNKKCV
jgi:endonuclease G